MGFVLGATITPSNHAFVWALRFPSSFAHLCFLDGQPHRARVWPRAPSAQVHDLELQMRARRPKYACRGASLSTCLLAYYTNIPRRAMRLDPIVGERERRLSIYVRRTLAEAILLLEIDWFVTIFMDNIFLLKTKQYIKIVFFNGNILTIYYHIILKQDGYITKRTKTRLQYDVKCICCCIHQGCGLFWPKTTFVQLNMRKPRCTVDFLASSHVLLQTFSLHKASRCHTQLPTPIALSRNFVFLLDLSYSSKAF